MQNFMKTILSAVQIWTKGKIKESTADWSQNDPSADNYVKNRTHWEDENGVVHKLNKKYLDLPDNVATTDDVNSAKQEAVKVANSAQSTANNAQTVANNAQTVANNAQAAVNSKMDVANPAGSGSLSINRKANTPIGKNSVAIGEDTIMSVNNGFVSGKYNYEPHAKRISSNQTEYFTQDKKTYHYAPEYTFSPVTGIYSLINAVETTGEYMKNNDIDISGMYVISDEMWGLKTMIYVKNFEYRQGYAAGAMYGDVYTSDVVPYANIIGNGTSDTTRSNAHTLDWKGVGWYQGGLQVGGNAQDDGAKNVLLEGEAVPMIKNAKAGQILSVKEVDENGKPMDWEAVDMASANGSTDEVYILSDGETLEDVPEGVELVIDPNGDFDSNFPSTESSGGGIAVTGAKVGQTVKISAVDENGVPTAWESVDFPSGGGGGAVRMHLITDFTTTEDLTKIVISEDKDGKPFSLSKIAVRGYVIGGESAGYIGCGANNAMFFTNKKLTASSQRDFYWYMELNDDGTMNGHFGGEGAGTFQVTSATFNYSYRNYGDNITSIFFQTGTPAQFIATGSRFVIYGA